MQDKDSPLIVLTLVVAGALVIVGALLLSGLARDDTPAADTATATTAAAATVPAPLADREEARAPADVVPEASAVRPETALLEELPEVRMIRAADSPLDDLKVSFKLEARLTRSLYMGDRWLSPPTYLQVGAGKTCTLEASIRGLNAQGKAVNTPATWRATDPDMVQISEPGPGNTVKLTVVRPGETTVEIASQGITKQLPLHATSYGGTLLVAMAQE
jgi:hypothetical protein